MKQFKEQEAKLHQFELMQLERNRTENTGKETQYKEMVDELQNKLVYFESQLNDSRRELSKKQKEIVEIKLTNEDKSSII